MKKIITIIGLLYTFCTLSAVAGTDNASFCKDRKNAILKRTADFYKEISLLNDAFKDQNSFLSSNAVDSSCRSDQNLVLKDWISEDNFKTLVDKEILIKERTRKQRKAFSEWISVAHELRIIRINSGIAQPFYDTQDIGKLESLLDYESFGNQLPGNSDHPGRNLLVTLSSDNVWNLNCGSVYQYILPDRMKYSTSLKAEVAKIKEKIENDMSEVCGLKTGVSEENAVIAPTVSFQ